MHTLNMNHEEQLEKAHSKLERMKDYLSPRQWPHEDTWIATFECLSALQDVIEEEY